jgi:hypothetical protein
MLPVHVAHRGHAPIPYGLSGLSSWLGVMPVRAENGHSQIKRGIGTTTGADKSVVCSINRHLRRAGFICSSV